MNFGGNNLTYRIMQFMKVVFAEYYATGGRYSDTDIDMLIGIPGGDLYRHVDEFGIDAVYEKLEKGTWKLGKFCRRHSKTMRVQHAKSIKEY